VTRKDIPPLSTRELPMARAGQSVGSNGSCTAHTTAAHDALSNPLQSHQGLT
jgi:hypothetical protein